MTACGLFIKKDFFLYNKDRVSGVLERERVNKLLMVVAGNF